MLSKESLLDLYRKSDKNKKVLGPIFNPENGCFGCMIISIMSLEDACKHKGINIQDIIHRLS